MSQGKKKDYFKFNLSRVCPMGSQNQPLNIQILIITYIFSCPGFVKISLIINFLRSFGEKKRFPSWNLTHDLHLLSHLFKIYKNSNCYRQDKGRIQKLPVLG